MGDKSYSHKLQKLMAKVQQRLYVQENQTNQEWHWSIEHNDGERGLEANCNIVLKRKTYKSRCTISHFRIRFLLSIGLQVIDSSIQGTGLSSQHGTRDLFPRTVYKLYVPEGCRISNLSW